VNVPDNVLGSFKGFLWNNSNIFWDILKDTFLKVPDSSSRDFKICFFQNSLTFHRDISKDVSRFLLSSLDNS
jgi:hypothetical protein